MFGGVKSAGWATILVAGGVMLGGSLSAQAADLGGDCCADLEERVAELEATTARKGNRKVSLEVSGHINETLMWWDDGAEQNVYQVTNDNARSRFRFKGKAKISDEWSAGYMMEIGVRGANSKRTTQEDDDATDDSGFDVRHSYWYIDSKKLGRVSMGVTGAASEGVTEINLAHTKDVAKFSDVEDSGLGMFLRSPDGGLSGLQWRRLIGDSGDQPGEGERRSVVKYDTPEFAGFTGTVAFGEDDYWDAGLRYAAELGGFEIAAGIAYSENTDIQSSSAGRDVFFECMNQSGSEAPECNMVGGSVSVMHKESGLYANFGAGQQKDETILESTAFANTGADDTSTFWAVEGGIEKKWFDIGKTTLFGQYYQNEGGANNRRTLSDTDAINPFVANGTNERIYSTELNMIGGGIVQELSKASMLLYAYYRHYEADVTVLSGAAGGGVLADTDLEDLDVVMSGAMIKF